MLESPGWLVSETALLREMGKEKERMLNIHYIHTERYRCHIELKVCVDEKDRARFI